MWFVLPVFELSVVLTNSKHCDLLAGTAGSSARGVTRATEQGFSPLQLLSSGVIRLKSMH